MDGQRFCFQDLSHWLKVPALGVNDVLPCLCLIKRWTQTHAENHWVAPHSATVLNLSPNVQINEFDFLFRSFWLLNMIFLNWPSDKIIFPTKSIFKKEIKKSFLFVSAVIHLIPSVCIWLIDWLIYVGHGWITEQVYHAQRFMSHKQIKNKMNKHQTHFSKPDSLSSAVRLNVFSSWWFPSKSVFFHEVFPGMLNQPVMGTAEQRFPAADPQVWVFRSETLNPPWTYTVLVPEKPGTCPDRCWCNVGQQLDSGWTDAEVKTKNQTSQMPHVESFLRPSWHHFEL